jgi:hypothetical protein
LVLGFEEGGVEDGVDAHGGGQVELVVVLADAAGDGEGAEEAIVELLAGALGLEVAAVEEDAFAGLPEWEGPGGAV